MKNLLLIILVISSFISCEQSKKTTYYLIRHAEKDRTDAANQDPELTEKGKDRAEKWANYFKHISLDAVYSTPYQRTIQTAIPTALDKKIPISSYDANQLFTPEFQKATKGKSILIVGHSNTTPAFVNAILGEKKYKDMSDDDNGSLYIVIITENSKKAKVVKVE